MTRRRKNMVRMLKDDDGSWVEDDELLKKMVVSYYEELYKFERVADNFPLNLRFRRIDNDVLLRVSRLVEEREIEEAVFSIRAYKAP